MPMQYIITTRYGQVEVNSYEELIDCLFPQGQFDRRVWKSCEKDDDFWKSMAEENEHFSDLLKQATVAVNVLGRASEIYILPLLTEGDFDGTIVYVKTLKTIVEECALSSEGYFNALRELAQWFSPDYNQKPFASFEKNSEEAIHWIKRYRERYEFVHYYNGKGWIPDSGYVWQQTLRRCHAGVDNQLEPPDKVVVWNPGVSHSDVPHIHATNLEGKWSPDRGYECVCENDPLKGVVRKTTVSALEVSESLRDEGFLEGILRAFMKMNASSCNISTPKVDVIGDDVRMCSPQSLMINADDSPIRKIKMEGEDIIGSQEMKMIAKGLWTVQCIQNPFLRLLGPLKPFKRKYSTLLIFSKKGVYFANVSTPKKLEFVTWSDIRQLDVSKMTHQLTINGSGASLVVPSEHLGRISSAIESLANSCRVCDNVCVRCLDDAP